MTTPNEQPINIAGENSQVGVQAGHVDIDTVIIPGDVQLTVGQDASPKAKYRAGVENLKSGNPRMARQLIWEAMMSGHVNSEIVFHWLVAMLSGRTVQQFSTGEIDQLKHSRPRYAEARGDAWAGGIQLIYRLLDSVLSPTDSEAKRRTTDTDMSLLERQFENLGEKQRDMVRPHLELFLTGPLKDRMWQRELQLAQSGQHGGDRPGRSWMFFQPIPAEASLPSPQPERLSTADRVAMRASALLFVAVAGYLGWELLWHGAFLGLLSYAVALAGGAVAAVTDLESRFLTERLQQKDELFRIPAQSASSPLSDALTDDVDKLFKRYFNRYAPDKEEREHWQGAAGGIRKFHRDEIAEMCRASGIAVNRVAWLVRYEVRQMKQRWQNETLYEYRQQLLPRPGTSVARRTGLALLILGGVWATVALRAHLLAYMVALLSAFLAWRYWRRVNLERRRCAADSEEHSQRQAAIDKEFRRWSEKLEVRPKDADMAAWLACDRSVLLGEALDHFHQSRSRLAAHAFLEKPGVAAKRARIKDGPWRYAKYQLTVFLLGEDRFRQVRASLDFTTGMLTIRELNGHRYDAIVSVCVSKEARRQTFEVWLKAGEPIIVQVRNTDPSGAQPDKDAGPTEETQETAEAEEETALDVTSVADLMHLLERAVGDDRNWLRGRDGAGASSGDNEAHRREDDT